MGSNGHCCQETAQTAQPLGAPISYPLITPDGQQIESLEQYIKRLKKQLKRLKKKD